MNREVWYALFYDPKVSRSTYVPNKWATILAIEQPPNNTTVQFLDGIYFRLDRRDGRTEDYAIGYPIGQTFSVYAQFIKDEWAKGLHENQNSILQDVEAQTKNKRGRRNPNLDTPRKLRALVTIRENAIKRNIDIPSWSTACRLAGIDHKTASRYLQELRENWDVKD